MGTDRLMDHGAVDLAVGAFFVLLQSAHRLNTPPTNRSSTTAERYFLALTLYCLAALGTYFALVKFPDLVTFFSQGSSTDWPGYVKGLSNPLLIALLMTTLLPKLPLLSTVDQWILDQLKEMAAIPFEVRRLSAELRRQRPTISPDLQDGAGSKLKDEGFDEADVRFEPGQTPPQLWTSLTALFLGLEDWESDRKMAAYMATFGDCLQALRERYEGLLPKARTCFRLLRQSGGNDETDKAREATQRYAEDFADHVTELRRDLIEFISRGVLQTGLTDAARRNRLQALGFATPGSGGATLTLNQMMSLFCVVGVLMLSAFVIFSPGPGLTEGVILARAIMISVIYSVAVACVVLPRERWAFAKREPGRAHPVAFYIVAGLMAVAISQVIGFGFNCALQRTVADGARRYLLTYPWSVMTFTTSVVTGFLVDNQPRADVPRGLWRLLEGVTGAGAMLVAAWFTWSWLEHLLAAVPPETLRSLGYSVPPLASILGPAAAVGLAIGYLVPTWSREAPRARMEVQQAHLIEAV